MSTQAFIKPPVEDVREALKYAKERWDTPQAEANTYQMWRAAEFPNREDIFAWRGELLHQVGLWHAREGRLDRAVELLERALEMFDPNETMGPARTNRDISVLQRYRGDVEASLEQAIMARALHELDLEQASKVVAIDDPFGGKPRKKAERQLRIAEVRELEARVHADDDRREAIDALFHLALNGSRNFCLRDQLQGVTFLLPLVRGPELRALHIRQLEINALRLRPMATARSIVRVGMDQHLHAAGILAGKILGEERLRPRP